MKRILSLGAMMVAALVAADAAPAAAQAKLGFVNIQAIMAQAPGITEARQQFETEVQQAQPQLQQMQTELTTLQTEFERQQATLSADAKQERQQQFQEKLQTLQQRQQQLQRREQELLAPIMQKVEATIETVRAEGGYAMIFDTAQSGIVAADDALDLTNRVLDRLKTGTAGK